MAGLGHHFHCLSSPDAESSAGDKGSYLKLGSGKDGRMNGFWVLVSQACNLRTWEVCVIKRKMKRLQAVCVGGGNLRRVLTREGRKVNFGSVSLN